MDRDLILFISCVVFILAFLGYLVLIWIEERAIFKKENEQSDKDFEEELRQIGISMEKGHDKLKLVVNNK